MKTGTGTIEIKRIKKSETFNVLKITAMWLLLTFIAGLLVIGVTA